uniref:ATP synthase complex subunit 8 n=1 Tax=Ephemera orientalis TaxID=515277 RepID=C3RUN0_9INSE|nr:ATP synthase F0 subunit 8 [Ephemera orientalis]ACB48056.1 ATP synthase F0 subunit 8 [Ephemera orientalis]
MPQMAPLSWLTLFIMFSATLILFNIINYYSFETTPPSSSHTSVASAKAFNWQW